MGAEIEGEYRKDVYELPISAIRETIANAVLHRSYLDRSCIQVCLYDDRIEVSSPGIPRIINRCKEYDLPAPLFEEFGDGFKVTIFRKVSNGREKVSNDFEPYVILLKEVNTTDIFINNIEKVFKHCGTETLFGQSNVMRWLDCSKSKATNIMNILKKAHVIEKVTGLGPGKYKFLKL